MVAAGRCLASGLLAVCDAVAEMQAASESAVLDAGAVSAERGEELACDEVRVDGAISGPSA